MPPALRDEFAAQLDEWELWDRDSSAAFEALAEAFYAETGFIAPGKSLPLEMSNVQYDIERRQRYDQWQLARKEKRRQMLRHVLAALPEGRAEWQPISSAPKDVVLLIYRPGALPRDRIAVRRPFDWCGPTCCPSSEPTHWMPLPEIPTP